MRSLEAARKRAKELRAVIDQGGDPEIYNQERDNFRPINYETNKVRPVEDRAMAEECYKWAREAKANEARVSLK